MQGAAAAKGHVGKVARVVATLNRHHANGPRHLGVGHRQNRFGCGHHFQPQGPGHVLLNGRARLVRVHRREQAAPQGPVCSNAAQQHIGIGDRRPCVATPVTGRARVAAGRLGADLQHAAGIHRGDRAATGTDGLDLDHGRAHHHAKLNRGLGRQRRLALGHQRHIKRCAPHVTGDGIGEAR